MDQGDEQPHLSSLIALDGGEKACTRPGLISLVGAGPGDPDLLTLKAARLLASADVVVYDRLVGPGVLALVRDDARKLYVGKRKSRHSVPQEDVNRLLVALARQGLNVVRLKGGDPFLFGRGGEEMLAAREAGLECDIVPGVSAGLAASAALQAPITHRGLAQAVTFVTGHAASGGEPDLDWPSLARTNHTVVVYMGVSTAAVLSARLIGAGRAASTPVAVAQNVSRPDETRHLTTLAGLPALAETLDGPAILIIGESAALARTEAGRRLSPTILEAHA